MPSPTSLRPTRIQLLRSRSGGAHAAFSWRDQHVIASTSSASANSSNMCTAYLLKWTYAGHRGCRGSRVRSVEWIIRGLIRSFGGGFPTTRPALIIWAVCAGQMAFDARHVGAAERGRPRHSTGSVGCGRKTSVTAGTIFHRTRTPLSTWFAAIWLVTSQKNGASAQNLYDMLGLGSYETAWAWLHKLRRAMVRPDRELLCGVVEVDESFVGGRAAGRRGPPLIRHR